jgi:hypothetical protein
LWHNRKTLASPLPAVGRVAIRSVCRPDAGFSIQVRRAAHTMRSVRAGSMSTVMVRSPSMAKGMGGIASGW